MDQLSPILTPRWTQLRHHPEQVRLMESLARFKVVPAGRRSGKTELAKRRICEAAWSYQGSQGGRFFAAAPTRDQARRIYWDDLKALTPPWLLTKVSETALVISLRTGSEIHVVGMDRPERIEGSPWDGGVLDEYANMRPTAWTLNVRPALSDRRGWCWFIGVPEGRNHYYDLFRQTKLEAEAALREGRIPEWDAFHWPSADILLAEEIVSAQRDLDPLSYQQEYEGSFINFQGRVYYTFQFESQCRPLRDRYRPEAPLVFCLDFNVDPGVAVVAQEMTLPNGLEGTGIIGEVFIPRNSNTPAVCRKLIQDWGQHKGRVEVYGDATGGARGSARVQGSDWDLVQTELRPVFGPRLFFRYPGINPAERARVNAVCSRLKSTTGEIRLMVDPKAAPNMIRDLEGVQHLEGGSGEIDKRKDPMLTHLSDALGYYIFQLRNEGPRIKRLEW